MMCSRSLHLAVACLLCCIGSSIGFAPVRTVVGARSTNNQQLESLYRSNQVSGPRQSTLLYSGNPSKPLTSKVNKNKNNIAALAIVLAGIGLTAYPSPCFAASSILSNIPSPSKFKEAIVSVLDGMSQSGTKGMVAYVLSFTAWTMTVGVTTPVETAAGMAFPLKQSIPLSALGKIGGAFCQYVLAKYLFSDYAREKMKDNEWMGKIDKSFKSHPFGVALIWRFSPLPEFVKNVGPSLVKTLKTRYQLLAILAHGLPFTILWSFMGAETAAVARGGEASVLLKRLVAIISSVGLFVSPTLFGMWLKGLGDDTKSESQ
ncbi:hypothetical protein QTG54_000406 [Skeletonema marinoi]|uniref:VTT domain-containing protein n=2 Tax=Skeletonema marinoi TaxID=267567 RepID=A0AAD9DII5_9STRA|nr:hypothetical protein QTG54_000406 [Skeletonema marinoi]